VDRATAKTSRPGRAEGKSTERIVYTLDMSGLSATDVRQQYPEIYLRGCAALTSADIARRYAQGLKVEPRGAAALVRLGHVAGDDGRLTLRRAA
jgi:hypothetical protein